MIPSFVKPYLWFNDLTTIDPQKNKNRIILNVLNLGSKQATDWFFAFYSKRTIKRVIENYGAKGELSDKSLNYWILVLNIDKNKFIKSRF